MVASQTILSGLRQTGRDGAEFKNFKSVSAVTHRYLGKEVLGNGKPKPSQEVYS